MKNILFFLTISCSLLTINCFAQLVQQEWVARYTGPGNDLFGPFLALDKFGNSYVAGTHVINDSINILCVKYNTSGIQQWATLYKYPGEGYFAPAGLALDTFGNAYIISRYGQGTSFPLNSLIVKLNGSNGTVVWAKRYIGEYGWSSFLDIKIDRLNNIYAAGWSDTSHLVIKYNTNGDSVWVRRYHPYAPPGYFSREVAYACTIDDSLNVILTGHRLTYYMGNPSWDTLLVVKYSPDGSPRWAGTYANGFILNLGKKIAADQYGSVYIGGETKISGFVVYLTLKYDRNGFQQWAKIYDPPGNGDNILTGIAMDRVNSALFVTGRASTGNASFAATIKYNILTGDSVWVRSDTGIYRNGSSGDIKVDSFGNTYITGATNNIPPGSAIDALTIKYSKQGNIQWFITYNGPFDGGDAGYKLELDILNNIYVMGVSQSAFQVYDYIVIKYSQLVGIQPVGNEIPGVYKLEQNYPNPFNQSTIINYQLPIASNVTLRVYDVLGRAVNELVNEKQRAGNYSVRFNASELSSGVYLYRLIADYNIIDSKKLILLK